MRFTLIALTLVWLPATLADPDSPDGSSQPSEEVVEEVHVEILNPKPKLLSSDTDQRAVASHEAEETPPSSRCSSCWNWFFGPLAWRIFAPMHWLASTPPTLYKLMTDGLTRWPLEDWNHRGHSIQGFGAGFLIAEWNWEWMFKGCFGSTSKCCNWMCRNDNESAEKERQETADKCAKYLGAAAQVAQTAGLVGLATVYPAYNLKKRDEAADDGHYEKNGYYTYRVFDKGSFYDNQNDWVFGLTIALIVSMLGLVFCKGCCAATPASGNGCFDTWFRGDGYFRKYIHRPVIFLLLAYIGIISVMAVVWGVDTVDNVRTDHLTNAPSQQPTLEPTLLPTELTELIN